MISKQETDKAKKIFSDVIVNNKYAKFVPELHRRETWEEICMRNMEMHLKMVEDKNLTPDRKSEMRDKIHYAYENFIIPKKILPSMRSMQFGGFPIFLAPNRIYNCAYQAIDDIAAFSETMFLLLGGTGVGYSVQQHHIKDLPNVTKPFVKRS